MLKKGLETSYEDSNRCKHSKPANQKCQPKCKRDRRINLTGFFGTGRGKKSES